MASTLVKINVHLIFHTKSTGITMREEDLGRIFAYIGGIIKGLGGMPIEIGGMTDMCISLHLFRRQWHLLISSEQ